MIFSQALRKIMKDSVLVKAIYIYCIKKNVLDKIITLETDLEVLVTCRVFFSMNPTP
jgi:hypothetical protein